MPDDLHPSSPPAAVSAPEEDTADTNPAADANYWDYCPNCGRHLYNQGCKYRCPRCHYFMSCSDFD